MKKGQDLVFDIETMRNASMIDRLPALEVKAGNLKDPAKIAEKQEAAKNEQIEKMALSPLYGRICAWCAIDDDGKKYQECITADTNTAEAELIEKAFDLLGEYGKIITYNGNGFDFPFLYRRAALLGIPPSLYGLPPLAAITAKYRNELHVDLMQVWCGSGSYEKLDNIARALVNDQKIEIDFRDFPALIKTKKGQKQLLDYCMQDVRLTQQIWFRVNGILI